VTENPDGGTNVQAFSQSRECFGDPVGRGFQAIQGCVSARRKLGSASLAAEVLDLLLASMMTIADEYVDLGIRIAYVETS